jgi:hypothetical protein
MRCECPEFRDIRHASAAAAPGAFRRKRMLYWMLPAFENKARTI